MSGSAQADFLRRGGPMAAILDAKYESGELTRDTPYAEYPKMIRRSLGMKHFDHVTEIIEGNTKGLARWSEDKEAFEEIIVTSEAEEEAVLAGGKGEAEIEQERQALLTEGRQRGISVDPTWGLVRLQRELGAAPSSETIEVMRKQIADLEEKAALRARIAELEAQVGRIDVQTTGRLAVPSDDVLVRLRAEEGPHRAPHPVADDVENLRAQLTDLGVEIDRRWGLARLQQELEAATAPRE